MLKTYKVALTVDQGSSSDSATVPVTGYLRGLYCSAGAMDDDTQTYTVAITDEHGATVFSKASLAQNANTAIWADKYNELGTTRVEGDLLNTPMAGDITLTLTTSLAQYDAAVNYTVVVYYE